MATGTSMERELLQAVDSFKADAGLTKEELTQFQFSKLEDVQSAMASIQQQQTKKKRLQYMKRLEPFLETMNEYGKVVEVFLNVSNILAFVWGPMKYILLVTSTFSEAFGSILDAYEQIGDEIPLLSSYQTLFADNVHMRTLLVMIFKDILEFHKEAMRYFRKKLWKQLFQATWKGFVLKIENIKGSLARHRRLLESRASLVEIEEIRTLQQLTENKFEDQRKADLLRRRNAVLQWLSPANTQAIHEHHLMVRSNNPNAGQWLLQDQGLRAWTDPLYCSTPLLWINGKPGAGKTVLVSSIIEEVRKIPNVSVAFFYCSENDQTRNSFVSIARGLLAQLLAQDDNALLFIDEKMSTVSGEACLNSLALAKELLKTCLGSRKTYIILDGMDECGREQRKEVCTWFRSVVDSLPRQQMDEIRCLFVSQDDGIGRKDLSMLPSIRITPDNNRSDIEAFATDWNKRIGERFGAFSKDELDIVRVVSARSQGMFIFAKCVLEEMFQQPSREALLESWRENVFPAELDDLYERILARLLWRGPQSRRDVTKQLLSWICCAQRPMRWYEIQGAISIDPDNQTINEENKRLVSDSKDFCASLVEVYSDQTIVFVHSTLKEFLLRKQIVTTAGAGKELCQLTISYLCFPAINREIDSSTIELELLQGTYAFYEYAVACWVPHLLAWLPEASEDQIRDLTEDLECLLDLHYTEPERPQPLSKAIQGKIAVLENLDVYESLAQCIVWMRKHLTEVNTHTTDNSHDLLDFSSVTTSIRSVMESVASSQPTDNVKQQLERYYGSVWFKCPRIYCKHFYEGFVDPGDRDRHLARHDRPYLCRFEGCPTATFGCVAKADLDKHLLEYHGIYSETDEFPDTPNPNITSAQKQPATYQCNLCPKRFTRAYNLRSHLRIHTDERPFVCTICGKAFARQNDRKRHEGVHSGEKKFICKGDLAAGGQWGCGRKFARGDALGQHFKSPTGRVCIKPLLDEEQAKPDSAGQDPNVALYKQLTS